MNPKILIIGCGVVGSNVRDKLAKLNPDVVDKFKPELTHYDPNAEYDFAYVCVDTPFNEKGCCDTTEVFNAVRDNNAKVFVIKSSILPYTTERIKSETGKRVVFSPEFYGGTQHCNNWRFNFTILGGDIADCVAVQQMLQLVFDARHIFRFTNSRTAELVKYMENAYLATKVSFFVAFFQIAEKLGVCYETLRELVTLDPRIGKSHSFVYRDKPYWDTHCLNKDVPAIANFTQNNFLLSLVDFNADCKKSAHSESDT